MKVYRAAEILFKIEVVTLVVGVGVLIYAAFGLINSSAYARAGVHKYAVYYPDNCTFISGHYEFGDYWKAYQVICREGGDISTYVDMPSNLSYPAQFKHIPAKIRGFIYIKEID